MTDHQAVRLAIQHNAGRMELGRNPFGKDVANLGLFRALAEHGEFERLDFLSFWPMSEQAVRDTLLDGASGPALGVGHLLDAGALSRAGALLNGGPRLEGMAWQRRRLTGDAGFSLVGLIHTIAPPAMRSEIAQAAIAPVHPWDALICTSPSVQQAMRRMFEEWGDYLKDRFGAAARGPLPALPLIPLGVDGDVFAALADRPGVRMQVREALGADQDDVVVLWVGRLSYFEKAFPQPMMRAVAEAAAATGARVHFAMAGWFPDGERGRARYETAAQSYAANVAFHLIDGNDREAVGGLWAGADIFLSLVDNIQETFGITPVEAMAAGLPVVISDWDGYRFTVEDGQQGFLIPTLIGPEHAFPPTLAAGHSLALTSYQDYVGVIAQHTAVDVGAAARALEALIRSPDMRRRMGAAGRVRVRALFDWRVVAPQVAALVRELEGVRRQADGDGAKGAGNPTKGDPTRDFRGFATTALELDLTLALRPGAGRLDLERSAGLELDRIGAGMRGDPSLAAALVERLERGPATVRALLASVEPHRRRAGVLTLLWLAKLGVIAWSQTSP